MIFNSKAQQLTLLATTGLSFFSLPVEAISTTSKRPHIILIMTDQHRADALGCAGNQAILTPHIDKLAWSSV